MLSPYLTRLPCALQNALVKVFTDYGLPDIIHSDQGRNFESSILRQTLEAFGVAKSRTIGYHPQGDGMVERSLLQILRAYVQDQADWECLPLALYAYRIAVHTCVRCVRCVLSVSVTLAVH